MQHSRTLVNSFRAASLAQAVSFALFALGAHGAEPDMCIEDTVGSIGSNRASVLRGESVELQWSVSSPSCLVTVKVNNQTVGSTQGRTGSLTVIPQDSNSRYTLTVLRNGSSRHLGSVDVVVREPVAYTSANTPECTNDQITKLHQVIATQARTDVVDPLGTYIGFSEADAVAYRNWEPITGLKETLCGRLNDYGYFVPPVDMFDSKERDSNKYIIPGGAFRHMLYDGVNAGVTASVGDILAGESECGYINVGVPHGYMCIEAEATHHSTHVNPWFPRSGGADSPLQGLNICVQGPYVGDHGHGGRPEIHPSQGHWWATFPTPPGLIQETQVVLVQDDSNRYDHPIEDFTPDLVGIQAWNSSFRRAHVRYAFLLPGTGERQEYLSILNSSRYRNITTSQDFSGDATPGATHTLTYDGKPLFTVSESAAFDSHLSVVFDSNPAQSNEIFDFCKRPDGSVQGYAVLRTRFGLNNTGGEGFQELTLRHSANGPSANSKDGMGSSEALAKDLAVTPQKPDFARLQVDSSSVQIQRVAGGGIKVLGDLLLGQDGAATVERVALAGVPLDVRRLDEQLNQGLKVIGVDLTSQAELQLTDSQGRVHPAALPGLGLAVRLEGRVESPRFDDPMLASLWKAFAEAHLLPTGQPPSSLAMTDKWLVEATPFFSLVKNGKTRTDESYKLAEVLNLAASGQGPDQLRTAIHDSIKNVEWSGGVVKSDSSLLAPFVQLAANRGETGSVSVHFDTFLAVTPIVVRSIELPRLGLVLDSVSALENSLKSLVPEAGDMFSVDVPIAAREYFTKEERSRLLLKGAVARALRDGVVSLPELGRLITLVRFELQRNEEARKPKLGGVRVGAPHPGPPGVQ